MELANLDWIIIISFFIISFGISLRYQKSSGKDMKSFFLGGGNLPWYLAGISMVATTFAATGRTGKGPFDTQEFCFRVVFLDGHGKSVCSGQKGKRERGTRACIHVL